MRRHLPLLYLFTLFFLGPKATYSFDSLTHKNLPQCHCNEARGPGFEACMLQTLHCAEKGQYTIMFNEKGGIEFVHNINPCSYDVFGEISVCTNIVAPKHSKVSLKLKGSKGEYFLYEIVGKRGFELVLQVHGRKIIGAKLKELDSKGKLHHLYMMSNTSSNH